MSELPCAKTKTELCCDLSKKLGFTTKNISLGPKRITPTMMVRFEPSSSRDAKLKSLETPLSVF